MIREVVEQHAPPGSVPSEEIVEPPFVKEAEALVLGIWAIVKAIEASDLRMWRASRRWKIVN
jgi:hypothetical protein